MKARSRTRRKSSKYRPRPKTTHFTRVRKPLVSLLLECENHPMELPSREACYRALQSRDSRFDGLLFVGITSTRIYCRPICPARTAKYEHCIFFGSAAAAQDAGFPSLSSLPP